MSGSVARHVMACGLANVLVAATPHAAGPPDWLIAPTELSTLATLKVGDPAPAFLLPDAAGGRHALSDWHGQVVVLVFWASWCPHCRRLWPQIQTLIDFHAGAPLAVLGLNVWDEKAAAVAYRERHGLRFTILFADEAVARAYAVVSTPTTLVLDAEGRVAARILGVDPDDERLEQAVSAALKGVP